MESRNLGNSSLRVSAAGLGCNNFGGRIDRQATEKVVAKALDLGITFFDTADSYGNRGGSETLLGQALGSRRKDVVLATKFGNAMNDAGTMKGASRRYILDAVEASLRRLGTDWIDLYQQHRPDPATPIEETLRTLDDLVRQGKVRSIGCSNFTARQVADAQGTSRQWGLHSFVSCQNEYSLLARQIETELVPVLERFALGLLPYFPLASGLLTGKYRKNQVPPAGSRLAAWPEVTKPYLTDRNWKIVAALEKFSAARGRTVAELAIAWLASRPHVASVIAGATRPEQVEQNVRGLEWILSPAEIAEIDQLTAAS